MTDLGFGMADRRSVIVTLFVFVLSFVLLGYPLPIDTSNAVSTLIGLMLLTGYLYLSRSVLRLGLIIIYSLVSIPFDIYITINYASERSELTGIPYYKFKGRGTKGILLGIVDGLDTTWKTRFIGPLILMREWDFRSNVKKRFRKNFITLGILDRIALVVVAFLATFPAFANTVHQIGLIGILLITAIYIVTGRFSFILFDAMHKTELDEENNLKQQVEAARNPDINFPSTIYTKEAPHDYGP